LLFDADAGRFFMTPDQIAEAQKLARERKPKKEKSETSE
jgi:hypothetical protein